MLKHADGAAKRTQAPSSAIKRHQTSSAIKRHQAPSNIKRLNDFRPGEKLFILSQSGSVRSELSNEPREEGKQGTVQGPFNCARDGAPSKINPVHQEKEASSPALPSTSTNRNK